MVDNDVVGVADEVRADAVDVIAHRFEGESILARVKIHEVVLSGF